MTQHFGRNQETIGKRGKEHMPNIKSAMKRVNISAVARQRNRGVKTLLATTKRQFMTAVEAKNKDQAWQLFRQYCSALDKAAKKGIIKDNSASRKKHRAAQWLKKI
jgi:small subunit ribosomal protein S20